MTDQAPDPTKVLQEQIDELRAAVFGCANLIAMIPDATIMDYNRFQQGKAILKQRCDKLIDRLPDSQPEPEPEPEPKKAPPAPAVDLTDKEPAVIADAETLPVDPDWMPADGADLEAAAHILQHKTDSGTIFRIVAQDRTVFDVGIRLFAKAHNLLKKRLAES